MRANSPHLPEQFGLETVICTGVVSLERGKLRHVELGDIAKEVGGAIRLLVMTVPPVRKISIHLSKKHEWTKLGAACRLAPVVAAEIIASGISSSSVVEPSEARNWS